MSYRNQEADTKVILHLIHALDNIEKQVILSSPHQIQIF